MLVYGYLLLEKRTEGLVIMNLPQVYSYLFLSRGLQIGFIHHNIVYWGIGYTLSHPLHLLHTLILNV